MRFQLSVVALALANLGMAQAAGFDLNQANTQGVDKSRWNCSRCSVPHASGELGVSVVGTDADDPRAANRLGEESDLVAALQADLLYTSKDDGRLRVQADDLGMETGAAEIRFDNDQVGVHAGYRSNLQVDSGHAQTRYGLSGNDLVDSGELRTTELSKKRESWLLGAQYKGDHWRSFIDYEYQSKTGQQAGSTALLKSPVNIVKPIDHTTQKLKAGAELSGARWLAGLSYQGSLFDNGHDALYNGERGALTALEPGNEAHQLLASGQYRWQRSILSGRLVKGWQYQNEDYVDTLGVPPGITHLNGEVETWDANLKLTTRVSRDLRVNLKADYRDRDNKTPVQLFSTVAYDPNSGQATANVPLDSGRHAYLLDGNYRLAKGLRLSGGYQRVELERSNTVREQTDEDRLFARLSYSALANWAFSVEGELGRRDGSRYDATAATSSEDNPLLRKYHLADRDRNQVEVKVSHTPLANLGLELSYRYARDDYDASELGLTESTDNGYDLSLSYHPTSNTELYLFGGQQWIDASQAGSQGFVSPDWLGDTEDSFSHIGGGAVYSGLIQDRLSLGLDYQYSESQSDTQVTGPVSGQSPYGDYTAWSHNVTLYANYRLSKRARLRADYRYERYYDTDYADVAPGAIPGLVTLGEMGANYNAHQLMLTLSYAL
ncbi:decaheme-associated outer membrane protein, MtrB/PioB family [Ferrimonas sediminum]|uniref:Decaheme-associated outer membrane protein, MtrB/PioB family n=1 Tax=Ferrimonas sediminum TaxID=718193 RepID=A0A1G8QC57_9GAMM|nr:MtrB/PioB family decaheme-associated outer membrane protein [Ferrimonas sediminum]SDJ02362.1 decaheme-associated outer membrane protein, MtrB/PioB family [Ferrimonas sediminum]